MADNTGIEWTDATWNPIRGCSRVSDGCRHCYAETVANRFKGKGQPYEGLIAKGGQWNGQIKVIDHLMDWPLRKRKPMRIFVNSMSDLFHESVPDDVIDRIFAVMAMGHWHTFQVLTKRPERMLAYFSKMRKSSNRGFNVCAYFGATDNDVERIARIPHGLPNVWLGVSVENQATADERIPLLLQTPAAVRWISAEPLLDLVDISRWIDKNPLRGRYNCGGRYVMPESIDWVVVGGESGPLARPMHPQWARSLRDQCDATYVPFLFKQWGGLLPADACAASFSGKEIIDFDDGVRMICAGKKAAGRLLDGVLHDNYPVAEKTA